MSTDDRLEVLRRWNDTRVPYPQDRCLHELIEAQVDRSPGAVAVEHDGASVTYAGLDARANQVAHHLRRRGVQTEALVAIFLERSIDTIVAILGVLKAGAAYVPIDPAYPAARIEHILTASGAALLITQDWLLDRLGAHVQPVLCMRRSAALLASESDARPRLALSSRNPAYVIYTSGSTGKPKGAMIEHRGVCNLVLFVGRLFGFVPESRVLQFASMSFDASISEWAGALVSGAVLVLSSAMRILVGDELASFIRTHRISFLKVPPAVLRTLPVEPFPTLQTLVTAGERCPQELVDAWAEGRRFINCYGPTEATIGATAAICRKGDATTTIGRPNANTRIFILDGDLELVPVGEVGEICIAGDGLARGYLHHPELTAQRFVAHPYPQEPGERLYRTGDLGRWRPDGQIDYLGRVDEQVKIRGFRVELGEVEALLGAHPAVKKCAVIAEDTSAGTQRLVAFVEPHLGAAPRSSELRRFVGAAAPAHLVPAVCHLVSVFPLTTNGKVDKQALAALPRDEPDEADAAAAQTPDQTRLAQVWARLLGGRAETIAPVDSFFDRGGDSINVVQLVLGIERELGVRLDVRTVFADGTLAGLARAIRSAAATGAPASEAALAPIERAGDVPLSYPQQRLWFLSRLEPDNPFYNICTGFRLRGRLSTERLRAALDALIGRHEVLRSRFEDRDGDPIQHHAASPESCLRLELVDLAALPVPERDRELARLLEAEPHRVFDLSRGPLLHVTVLRLADDEHVLLLSIHHIIADGWSMDVLVRELGALYRGAQLADLPFQYADYAALQRRRLSDESLRHQLAYWQEHLRSLPRLAFPIDRVRPAAPRFRGRSLRFRITDDVRRGLQAAARRADATPFMALVSAFGVLLHRYTGQDDIVIGTPVAGRNAPGLERLIGFFANTLVLRIDVSGEPTFTALVRRTRRVLIDAYCNGDVPFEKLVESLSPQRDRSRNPLFQVMLAYQGTPAAPLELSGLEVEPLALESGSSKFDLTLLLREAADGLEARLEYDSELFGDETPRRFVAHFERLLAQLARDPEATISHHDLLSEEERTLVLRRWSWIAGEYPRRSAIHDMIEAQARHHPERVAVVGPSSQLTYGELDRRANQLAHLLLEHGATFEAPIAVYLDRSPDVAVCLLGISKAGCAYLPLSETLPPIRLREILEDSCAPIMLTRPGKAAGLELQALRVIELATLAELDAQPAHPVDRDVGPDRLAYIIYTSGTTGRPKGVCVEHHTLTNLAVWQEQQFAPPHPLRISLNASLGFDMSLQEITHTLACGHTLVLPAEEARLDFRLLLRFIAEQALDVLYIPTALFHQLAVDGLIDGEVSRRLRAFIVAGEALKLHPHMRRLARCFPQAQIINQYGPTETHVVTSHIVDEHAWETSSVPIGVPIQNTAVVILDGERKPVPIGMVGEIYLGGACLARGYLGRPELTAERFIASPLGDPDAPRLYRTGDLARWLPDGTIQYLGRGDTQVKLRGYRIELGEIEAALREHPNVHDAVVVLHGTEDARLVAYVVGDAAAPELGAHLAKRLPSYMVPATFVQLDALPLSGNGKVDRAALPPPDARRVLGPAPSAPPRTPMEQELVRIWEATLQVQPIGVRDDFFALGGHSLLAIKLLTRIQASLGRAIPLGLLFRATTIEALAAALDDAGPAADRSPLVCLKPGARPPLVLVHPGLGTTFCYRPLADRLPAEQAVYALHARGLEPGEALLASVEELAARYLEALGPLGDTCVLGGWSFGGLVAYEMARRLHAGGRRVGAVVLIDTYLPAGDPPPASVRSMARVARALGLAASADELRGLAREDQIALLAARAVAAELLASSAAHASMARLVELFETHERAAASYQPGAYAGDVLLIRATEPFEGAARDRDGAAWRAIAPAVQVAAALGDHFTMMTGSIAAVAELVRDVLDGAARAPTDGRG